MGLARTRPDGGAQADSDEFRRYEAALRSYFRRRAPAPQVDDLVQEALARLIATQQDTQVQPPLAYLFRIASDLMADRARRSEEHTSELQTLMHIASAVICLKTKNKK